MGRHKLAAALTIATGLLSASAASAADCTLKQYANLELTLLPDGRYAVPVAVNGVEQLFILQLESLDSFIAPSFADQLKLQRGRVHREGVTVSLDHVHNLTEVAEIDELSLGNGHFKDTKLLLLPPSMSTDKSLGGYIGLDFLTAFDMEIDFANHKLKLFDHEHCSGNVVYWTNAYAQIAINRQMAGQMLLPMTLDGKRVDIGLNSTDYSSTMTLNEAHELFGLDKTSPGVTPAPAEPDQPPRYRYPFKTLTLGGLTINNPSILLVDDPEARPCKGQPSMIQMCFGGADAWLTLQELKQLHLFFAFRENMLYLTAADAH